MKKDPWFRNRLIRDGIYRALHEEMTARPMPRPARPDTSGVVTTPPPLRWIQRLSQGIL